MDLKITDNRIENLTGIQETKETSEQPDFSFTLNKVTNENLMTKLHQMMDDISAQGKKLADHMDIRDMKKYRSMITEFINEVVTNSHEFSRENFLDRRGRHRVYGIVKLVNKNVDDLAQELLKKEKDHIAILDKTNEIQGLLLDIIV